MYMHVAAVALARNVQAPMCCGAGERGCDVPNILRVGADVVLL